MENNNLIGIVTVLYNSDDVLPGFFKSLSDQKNVIFRLYVIDNSATDSGVEMAKSLSRKYGINAKFLFNNANVGVAKGNNQGIEMALADGCDYVLLANNDTEFEADTIRILLDSLVASNNAVATPKILYFGSDALVWYAGGEIKRWSLRTPHHGILTKDYLGREYPAYTGYAPTCFMLINAQVFADVGVMDEKYFVYYDDVDFVWRLTNKNVQIRLVNEAVVQHKVSTSTGGEKSPFSIYYTNRNRIYFARKNLGFINKIITISYIFATRVFYSFMLPGPLRSKMWSGIRDGFKMELRGR